MTITTRRALTALFASSILLVASFGTPAQAQTPAPSGQTAPSMGLNLDAAQRAKADARQAQFKKDYAAVSADPKLSPTQKQAKALSLYQEMDKDMLAILTPDQRTKVLKQRQINIQFQTDVRALQANKTLTNTQKQQRYIQITKNAHAASIALLPPAERAAALKRDAAIEQAQSLGLQLTKSETPTQSQKLKEIAELARASMQAAIADKTLSAPDKTAKINALQKDALSRDLALLTPSQRALYKRIQALTPKPTN